MQSQSKLIQTLSTSEQTILYINRPLLQITQFNFQLRPGQNKQKHTEEKLCKYFVDLGKIKVKPKGLWPPCSTAENGPHISVRPCLSGFPQTMRKWCAISDLCF